MPGKQGSDMTSRNKISELYSNEYESFDWMPYVVLRKSDIICSKNISFDTILFLLHHYEGYEQCWFIFVISDIALYFCHGCMDTKVTKIENLQLANHGFLLTRVRFEYCIGVDG